MEVSKVISTTAKHLSNAIKEVKSAYQLHAFLALVVCLTLGLVALMSKDWVAIISVVGLILVTIALLHHSQGSWDNQARTRLTEESFDLGVRVKIVNPHKSLEKYKELFDGFRGHEFRAYNPPFKVEDKVVDSGLETHERRYANGVTSRYLFVNGDYKNNARKFFLKLKNRLSENEIEFQHTINFREDSKLDHKSKSKADDQQYLKPRNLVNTFFIGYKGQNGEDNIPAVILYLEVDDLSGIPRVAICCENHTGIYSVFQSFFDKEWERSTELKNYPSL